MGADRVMTTAARHLVATLAVVLVNVTWVGIAVAL